MFANLIKRAGYSSITKKRIRNFAWIGASMAAALATAGPVAADYPEKAITLVAPYGAGGSSDIASRTLAKHAEKYVGQPIQVVNRTGAGGVVGSTSVLKSEPDGYTLLLARIGSHAVTPARNPSIPYSWDSFTYLGLLELNPLVCVVNADLPYKTIEDLAKKLKSDPGTINFASAGVGTVDFMTSYRLLLVTGAGKDAAVHIPAGSGGKAVTSVVGGHTDYTCQNLAPAKSNLDAGKLRALLVTTPDRIPSLPDVPTAREAGYPDLEGMVGWSALTAPPDLPKTVKNFWVDVLEKVKNDPEWVAATKKLGSVPYIQSSEETLKFVERQYDIYHELAKELDLIIQ
jgi:tripartite-type tricarboxylate transporter receptor subunit TctC